jgi:hypothetical protein
MNISIEMWLSADEIRRPRAVRKLNRVANV